MRKTAAPVLLAALLAPAGLVAQEPQGPVHHSPYAGTGSSEVPTLTDLEVSQLRAGEGMGLARPAELNGYPGPRHVLDLADSLGLTSEQRERAQAIFDVMHGEAVRVGESVIEAERALHEAFAGGAGGEVDRDRLEGLADEVGRLRAELRWVHLRAHLELARVLTRHQRHEYDRLRGYTDGGHGVH